MRRRNKLGFVRFYMGPGGGGACPKGKRTSFFNEGAGGARTPAKTMTSAYDYYQKSAEERTRTQRRNT